MNPESFPRIRKSYNTPLTKHALNQHVERAAHQVGHVCGQLLVSGHHYNGVGRNWMVIFCGHHTR